MRRSFRTIAVTAFVALPFAAMADDMAMHPSASPADKAFMAGMMAMHAKMAAAKPTGDTDRDFVAMMLPHHEGAVAMAKVELQYGKDPVLRKMAEDIVRSQEQEIGVMKAWQAKHGG